MDFNLSSYWERRYAVGKTSGEGSYGAEAQFKARFINDFIKSYAIKKVVEIGCGDGNNLKLYEGFDHYCGYDISPTAVMMCRRIHPRYYFTTDISKVTKRPDLCLCLDVLFHQVEDRDYHALMDFMFKDLQARHIIIYSTSHDDNEGMAAHMRNRDFLKDIPPGYELIEKSDGYDYRKIFAVFSAK